MNENTRAVSNYPADRGAGQIESSRPVSSSMTELASCIGDLETAARALAGRISPVLPSGSPFERAEKNASLGEVSTPNTPRVIRSHLCDELQSRIYSLRAITASINEMVKSSEL